LRLVISSRLCHGNTTYGSSGITQAEKWQLT
jgi:hypothetical protein